MLGRDKLFHPATAIALVALFVSLGGASYAAVTIRNGAVTTSKLANSAVTAKKLRNGAVGNKKIGRGAIGASKLARGAVGAAALANGAVGPTAIARGAVGSGQLAPGAVGAAALRDGAVSSGRLANNAVTSGKLADRAVTSGKLADRAVTNSKLGDASVTSGRLGNAAVTTEKLADTSVTTARIADGSVSPARLAPGAAVQGVGTVFHTSLTLGVGQTITLDQFPSLGTLQGTCAAGGLAATQWFNNSGGTISVGDWGVINGATDAAFVDHNNPANGLTVPAPNGGNGPYSVTWQVASGQGASAHVATVEVTGSATSATTCAITVQAISS